MNRTHLRAALAACVVGLGAAVPPASAETTIVCLGDSLTEGYGVAPEQAFPALLEQRLRDLGHEVRVINAGISGSTSASGVSRLKWQLRAKPDILVLSLGANDALRGVDLASTRRNLAQTIDLAKANGVQVVLAGMKIPPNYGLDYTRRFERMFPELADALGVGLIDFLLEGVAGDRSLNLLDGIHPNAAGYRIVVENVVPAVLPLL